MYPIPKGHNSKSRYEVLLNGSPCKKSIEEVHDMVIASYWNRLSTPSLQISVKVENIISIGE